MDDFNRTNNSITFKKDDVISWFRKWCGIDIHYQALDNKRCSFTSSNMFWGPVNFIIPQPLENTCELCQVDRDSVSCRVLSRFPFMFFPDEIVHQVGDGSYLVSWKDRLSHPYKTAMKGFTPTDIHFEGEDIVLDGYMNGE